MLGASILPKKSRTRGLGPHEEAEFWLTAGLDRDGLEVRYVSHKVGRGVFATKQFEKGDFLLEYVGDLIDRKEGERRDRTIYKKERHSYLFYFRDQEKNLCLDASRTFSRMGRMVNDSLSPNSKIKKLHIRGSRTPHLVLFASRRVEPGEEIVFDYGDNTVPWRCQEVEESESEYDSDPFDLEKKSVKSPEYISDQGKSPGSVQHPDSGTETSAFNHQEVERSESDQSFAQGNSPGSVQHPDSGTEASVFINHQETIQDQNKLHVEAIFLDPKTGEFTSVCPPDIVEDSCSCESASEGACFSGETTQDQNKLHVEAIFLDPKTGEFTSVCPPDIVEDSCSCESPSEGACFFGAALQLNNNGDGEAVERSKFTKRKCNFTSRKQDLDKKPKNCKPMEKKFDDDNSSENSADESGSMYEPGSDEDSEDSLEPETVPEEPLGVSAMREHFKYSTYESGSENSDEDSDEDSEAETVRKEPLVTKETNGPVSNPAMREHYKDITVPLYCASEGRRDYQKVNYCLYCGGRYRSKISEHYRNVHCEEARVGEILSLPVGSRERKKGLLLLQNEGNYEHNVKVIQQQKGELVISRRLHSTTKYRAEDFFPCEYCFVFVLKESLYLHASSCFFRPEVMGDIQKPNYVRNGYMMILPFVSQTPEEERSVSDIIDGMKETTKNPRIREICKGDELIKEFGLCMVDKLGLEEEQRRRDKTNIRTKMRTIARLLTKLRGDKLEGLPLSTFLTGGKFMEVVRAVKELAVENDSPNLALTLGHYLKQLSLLKRSLAIRGADVEMKKQANEFLELYEAHWNAKVSSVAFRRQKLRAINKDVSAPATKDLVTLRNYLVSFITEAMKRSDPSNNEWKMLAKHILVRIVLFNKRRIAEVEEMKTSDFLDRPTFQENVEILSSMSVAEQMLAQRMSLVEVRGKSTRGIRKVFVLLTPEMVRALNFLIETRVVACVQPANKFLFANEALGPLDGCKAFRDITSLCPGLTNTGAIRSTKLRKYLGTTSQILDMKDGELKMLADHLGHHINIHANYYRLQSSVLEKSKVARVLMAVENGMVGKFAGKSLEGIDIDQLPTPVAYGDSWQDEEPEVNLPGPDAHDDDPGEEEHCLTRESSGTVTRLRQRAVKPRTPWSSGEIQRLKENFPCFRQIYPSAKELDDLIAKYPEQFAKRSVKQLKSKLQHLNSVV